MTMTAIQMTQRNRRRIAQAGLTARGVLYCVVGVLAVQLAFGGGQEDASQQGALQSIAAQGAWGTVLVGLVGVGLLGYGLWRLTQFFIEKGDDEDSDTKKWIMRASYIVRALIYGGLSVLAFRIALGGGGGGNSEQTMTGRIMRDVPAGRWLVGLVGVIIIAVGCYQAYQAFSKDFMEELQTQRMSATERTWMRRLGVLGHSARAVVFGLIGLFVIRAAVQFDAQEASGLDGALQSLAGQPAGPWLLALTALGLFAFGVYTIVRARYVDVSE
jgi:hypothetical protein